MEIQFCPDCGCDDVDRSHSSFEYGGSTTWSCTDCEWHYTKGRGIGTGTSDSGSHPRSSTRWCDTCNYVLESAEAVNTHCCTPKQVIEAHGEPITYEDIVDEIAPYQSESSVKRQVRDGISEGILKVVMNYSPKFTLRGRENTEGNRIGRLKRTEMHDMIIDVLKEKDGLTLGELKQEMVLKDEWAKSYLKKCVRDLDDWGEVHWGIGTGITLSDSPLNP